MASFTYQSANSQQRARNRVKQSFIKRNWFEILILLGLFYLLLCRDVHMTIGYSAPDQSGFLQESLTDKGLSSFGLLTGHSFSASESDVISLFQQPILPAILSSTDQERLNACQSFIERFAKVAISEQEKFGIPASISLAQALLASRAGEHTMAREGNNFFGTICTAGTSCIDLNGRKVANYNTPWESFREHSLLLSSAQFEALARHRQDDYQAWAHGLVQAGYYPDEAYAEKLIQIIESLDLYLFDQNFS